MASTRWTDTGSDPSVRQLAAQAVGHRLVLDRAVDAFEQYGQPLQLLDDLPSAAGDRVHHTVEYVGMDRHPTPVGGRKVEHLLGKPLNAVHEDVRAAAWARRWGYLEHVADLVVNQWPGAAEEHGDQHFVAIHARRYRPVAFVDHFDDGEVLVEVQAGMPIALGGQHAGLGGGVLVEELLAPDFLDTPPRLIREDLRSGEHRAGGMWRCPARCSSTSLRFTAGTVTSSSKCSISKSFVSTGSSWIGWSTGPAWKRR
jgi:hypothetical protein